MTGKLITIAIASVVLVFEPSGLAEHGPSQPLSVAATQRIDFVQEGTIQIDGSYGYLSVDGWDLPAVEIEVVKMTKRFGRPAEDEQLKQRLDGIRVTAERKSPTELVITTSPHHGGIDLECRIHAPRKSRFVIHHGAGYVWLSDIDGDIDASSRGGDMTVTLAGADRYEIDARSRFGNVACDCVGDGHNRLIMGARFTHVSETPSRRVRLRMGRGTIAINQVPSLSPQTAPTRSVDVAVR